MGQNQLLAPMLGALWSGALAVSIGVSPCAAQNVVQAPSNSDVSDEMPSPSASVDDLIDMDLDQLSKVDVLVPAMDTVVTSVSRQEGTVGRSPTAIFVITPEMIRRSAANNIPDLLRMVPGVDVAQINADTWAISIRGFNGQYASKLLVQIDGRAVYSQLFNGVFWDVQDYPLEDIDRIEVIRGPGATVWGANAVNGVINIVTKRAADTQGLLVRAGGGSEDRQFSTVRYGGQAGEDVYWRIYGKEFDRDGGYFPDGAFDDWRQGRGGFRSEWTPSDSDVFTFQGDWYEGLSGQLSTQSFPTAPYVRSLRFDDRAFGQNILSRWTHTVDDDTDWALQTYFDRAGRTTEIGDPLQETLDVDYQFHFLIGDEHNVICGAGYRHIEDQLLGTFNVALDPAYRTTNLYSCFIQDEIMLQEDLWYLVVGSKFEHNDFSGFEYQPSVRLLYTPSKRKTWWAAVSRAVRTPSRVNQNLISHQFVSPIGPTFVEILGDPTPVSEALLAYELGYRAQPTDEFAWDLALFYNDYTRLTGFGATGAPFFDPSIPAVLIPTELTNSRAGDTYGAELSASYRLAPDWEISGAYTFLQMDVLTVDGVAIDGVSPQNQLYVHSAWNLPRDWEFDLIGRYVDSLPALGVSSYTTMDVRFAWRPRKNFEWDIVGRNLLDSPHLEFVDIEGGTASTEVQAQVFTSLTWTY
jgi:iron complex outermembrane receptor protein